MSSAQRTTFSHRFILLCLVGLMMTFAAPAAANPTSTPNELQRMKGVSPELPPVAEKTLSVEEQNIAFLV